MKSLPWMKWTLYILGGLIVLGVIAFYTLEFEYAYTPPEDNIFKPSRQQQILANGAEDSVSEDEAKDNGQEEDSGEDSQDDSVSFDVWGKHITPDEAEGLLLTEEGHAYLSPKNGAVAIDQDFKELGREQFYNETFGNEVFLTDIVGIVDGPITIPNITKAILELGGEATDNLRVELAESITIGGKRYAKGEKVDTGLDVAQGAKAPIGMPVKVSEGRVRVGVSCAACHAAVDRESGQVIEGAPNANLDTGLLLAMATNSAAYFTNSEVTALQDYMHEDSPTVETTDGKQAPLPDPAALEKAVDEVLVKWPPGSFDSTIDMTANPSQIPDSFTLGDHPYGWSGFAMAGPFNGLSVFNNNVHAQNTDISSLADQSQALFATDKEVFLGTMLQNAAHPEFRYDPQSEEKPSRFFASVSPTPGTPGVNETIKPPSYPKVTLMAPNGSLISSPGFNVGEQINALSAFQNSLSPPEPKADIDREQVEQGRKVFERAGCSRCHAGDAHTNNRIIPAREIGTQPKRATAFKATQKIFGAARIYAPDTPVPIPENAQVVDVPTDHLDDKQIRLAYAHDGSAGGYKVKGLKGLYWTAPYLHDGGVAVGADPDKEAGVVGTLLQGKKPDPRNSLKALVDRALREDVIRANRQSEDLRDINVEGIGHEYWVDQQAGFSEKEQQALLDYLLSI